MKLSGLIYRLKDALNEAQRYERLMELEMDLRFLNCLRYVRGRIFSFSQSVTNPSYNFERVGVSEMGQTPAKPSILSFIC